MNPALAAPIARGRTAEVYAWSPGQVLKLYYDWCPAHWVESEQRTVHTVHAAGIPTPAAGEIVEVDGRRGLVFERVDGQSMLADLARRPWRMALHARSLARLQAQIHRVQSADAPAYVDSLAAIINRSAHVPDDLRRPLLERLARLPREDCLCHGDFHPGNILLTQTGPVIIDWMTVARGSPGADVARTNLLLSIGVQGAGDQVPAHVRLLVSLFRRIYLDTYRRLNPRGMQAFSQWLPVIAGARLDEAITPERAALIDLARSV